MDDDSAGLDGGTSRDGAPVCVWEALVERATALLEADRAEFLVETGDRLVVHASSDPEPADGDRSYPLFTGIPGRAYTTATPCVVDDCLDTRSTAAAEPTSSTTSGPFRSLCCVPVDSRGLLLAKASRPAAFTDRDLEVLGHLVDLVDTLIDRTAALQHPVSDGGKRNDADHARRLEEIADILSHDLKNPLNVAQGNLQLAREEGDAHYFDRAASALQRIEELVDEVVFLARTGDLIEQTEPVELQERVETAWQNVRPEDATLEVTGSVTFHASDRGVSHLLENLVENAVTHAGPAVTVRVGGLADGFYIEDDGPGIPEEHRDRIFDRGYSVDAHTSGLGLHIAKRIVEAHGWDIDVETGASGGARFEVTGVDLV